ncbi:unnamed protein product, partial [Musa acuminata subsp. burmannicoides]
GCHTLQNNFFSGNNFRSILLPFRFIVLSQLAPYIILAEKLGSLAVQLVAGGSGIKGVKIILPTKEASALADERNFHDNSPEIPLDSIQVHLTNAESKFVSILSDAGDILVEGKVKDDFPHLTPVGSFSVDVSLEGNLILCRQDDQPGMIGHMGRILGDENQAKMAIGVDEKPDKETLKIGERYQPSKNLCSLDYSLEIFHGCNF